MSNFQTLRNYSLPSIDKRYFTLYFLVVFFNVESSLEYSGTDVTRLAWISENGVLTTTIDL